MSVAFLRSILILRCLLSLALTGYLLTAGLSTLPSILRAFGFFLAIDGLLALLLAVLILAAHWFRVLAALSTIGGLIRICAAVAILWGRGMLSFPVTLMLFIAVLATLAFLLGLLRLSAARKLEAQLGGNPWSVVLIAQGIVVIVLAIVAFVATPTPLGASRLLAAGEAILALALLLVAWHVDQPAMSSEAQAP